MNLTSPAQVREWCRGRDFHPNRTLGQNFLIDRNVRDAIVSAAGVRAGQRVLEVGPGLGVLTTALLAAGAAVTAVEKDTRLAAWLAESLDGAAGFTLLAADALDLGPDRLLAAGFDATVSNLPYSVGTRILLDLALHPASPPRHTVTVQREVAERFAAPAGAPARGQAGVWLQRLYDVALVRAISPTCFWPQPEVASALVRLERHDRHPLPPPAAACFLAVTRQAFLHRRKQMPVTLRGAPPPLRRDAEAGRRLLAACGIDPQARPETLDVAQWCALASALAADG
jgi:16S rRNA (adenine1518-N6/adenine1519-N6)-dimethyltransferase